MRGGVVSEYSAGEAGRFERVPLARGAQLDLRGGCGFARVAHLGVLAGALLADALDPALDLVRPPRGAAPALLNAAARLLPLARSSLGVALGTPATEPAGAARFLLRLRRALAQHSDLGPGGLSFGVQRGEGFGVRLLRGGLRRLRDLFELVQLGGLLLAQPGELPGCIVPDGGLLLGVCSFAGELVDLFGHGRGVAGDDAVHVALGLLSGFVEATV